MEAEHGHTSATSSRRSWAPWRVERGVPGRSVSQHIDRTATPTTKKGAVGVEAKPGENRRRRSFYNKAQCITEHRKPKRGWRHRLQSFRKTKLRAQDFLLILNGAPSSPGGGVLRHPPMSDL